MQKSVAMTEKMHDNAFPAVNKRAEEKITNICISLGIPANLQGYRFLRVAVKVAINTPETVSCMTKKLYPKVATHFGTSASRVERSIRHAINVAWNKGRIPNINSIFGIDAYNLNEKPTNGELIALLADKILFDYI